MLTPTWDPCIAFRFRTDDGNEAGATWKAAENTGITQLTDEVFRLRVASQMTNSGDTTSVSWTLQSRLNGGTWGNAATANSAHVSNGTNTTKQLAGGSGSFIAGRIIAGGSSASPSLSMTASSHTENEWVLTLSPSLSNGDIVDFRVLVDSTLHTNSQMPSITVSSPAPALAPTLLTPADEAVHHGLDFTWQFNTDNASFGVTGQEAFAFRRAAPAAGWGTVPDTPVVEATSLAVAYNHDSTLLAIAESFSISPGLRVYDTSTWTVVSEAPTLPETTIYDVEFSADGSRLAVAYDVSPFLKVYNTATWEEISGTPTLAARGVRNGLSWSPDGAWLAVQTWLSASPLVVYNTSTWATVQSLTQAGFPYGCVFNHDGSLLAACPSSSPRLYVWTTSNWTAVSGLPTYLYTFNGGPEFSPDGSVLALGAENYVSGGLVALNTSNWSEITKTGSLAGQAWDVAFNPDGSYIAITHDNSPFLSVWNTASWTLVEGVPVQTHEGNGVDFSHDGTTLALAKVTTFLSVLSVGGALLYEWWNGTGWQGSEVFIESSDEFLDLPPGAFDA